MSLLNHVKTDSVVTLLHLVEQLVAALDSSLRRRSNGWNRGGRNSGRHTRVTHLRSSGTTTDKVVVFDGGVRYVTHSCRNDRSDCLQDVGEQHDFPSRARSFTLGARFAADVRWARPSAANNAQQ